MTNNKENAGAEPAKSQAQLDETIRRLADLEKDVAKDKSAHAKQIEDEKSARQKEADRLSQLIKAHEQSEKTLQKAIESSREKDKKIESQGQVIETLKDVQAKQSQLIAAIVERDSLLSDQITGRDLVINQLIATTQQLAEMQGGQGETLSKLLSGLESSTGLLGDVAKAQAEGNRLVTSIINTMSGHTTSLGQITDSIDVLGGDLRTSWDQQTEKSDSLQSGVSSLLGSVRLIRRDLGRVMRWASTLPDLRGFVERVDELLPKVLTTKMFLLANAELKKDLIAETAELKKDLIAEVNKLPEALSKGVKEIVKAAAQIQNDASNFAELSALDLINLKGQISSFINTMQRTGDNSLTLMKDSVDQFRTGLTQDLLKIRLTAESRQVEFISEAETQIRKLQDVFTDSNVYKTIVSLEDLYRKSHALSEATNKTINEFQQHEANAQAKLKTAVDSVTSGFGVLNTEVANATAKSTAVLTTLTQVQESSTGLGLQAKALLDSFQTVHNLVQRYLDADSKAKSERDKELVNALVDKLQTGISNDVADKIEVLADAFGLESFKNTILPSDNNN